MGLWHPEAYQGSRKRRNYFEGWYYKLVNRDRSRSLALIPGLALGERKDQAHAFLQAVDAQRGIVAYLRYPLSMFHADHRRVDVRIGNNRFQTTGFSVNHEDDTHTLQGEMRFTDIEPYPVGGLHRGIMGPFTFVPFMECRHGVVSLRHRLEGGLLFDGEWIDFTDGEGYVEKDWGRSFPSAWVWLQASHFAQPGTSFMFSVAQIPWLGRHFTGLLCFLKTKDRFIRIATYNGARIERLEITADRVEARIRHPRGRLDMEAVLSPGSVLRAPKNGVMIGSIEETLEAVVTIRLYDRAGHVWFEGTGSHTAMEISDGANRLAVPPVRPVGNHSIHQ